MPTEGGLLVLCANCGCVLAEPGALVFSPPNASGLVWKYHVCAACYRTALAHLAGAGLT